jgi:hypothetical protein
MRDDGAGREEGGRQEMQDRAWPVAVQWGLGEARAHMTDILWRCDALRAGRLYQRSLFATREEAEEFAEKLRSAEPDHVLNVEAIKASSVWN